MITRPGCRAILAYLGLCIALLVGIVGIRSYVYVATEYKVARMRESEASAAKAGSAQLVVHFVNMRDILLRYGSPVDWLICVCLVAGGLGLVMGVRRLWQRPPAGTQLDKFCLPRSMLVMLACEMGAVGGATGLAVVLFLLI